jgi:hypothetical protein
LELHADRVYPVDELDACLPDDRQGDVAGRSTSKPAGPSAAVERLLERLDGVVEAASGWRALCPAHDDHEPSLSVTVGRDGCCLVCCHAGCGVEAIVAAVGLELPDLFDDGPSGGRRKSAKLVALADASGLELFRTPGGRAHASFPVDGHRETWPLRSYGMEWWLRRLRFERSREPLAAEVVAETLATFEAQAQFDGDEREAHRRVAAADGGVVIDVGDSAWRTIEVSAGGWRLLDGAAVPFVRDRSTLPLAEPVEGGSIDELRAFVNCSDERSWLLLVGSLLMCSNPRGPYPIIYPTGEQGSAKSTLSRLIVSLVDPRRAPLAMGTPSVRDLAAIADSVWLVGFDNVSHIPPALSDALCQLVTGAGYRARQLYTDTDSVALDLKRPVLINGIGQVAVRPD